MCSMRISASSGGDDDNPFAGLHLGVHDRQTRSLGVVEPDAPDFQITHLTDPKSGPAQADCLVSRPPYLRAVVVQVSQ